MGSRPLCFECIDFRPAYEPVAPQHSGYSFGDRVKEQVRAPAVGPEWNFHVRSLTWLGIGLVLADRYFSGTGAFPMAFTDSQTWYRIRLCRTGKIAHGKRFFDKSTFRWTPDRSPGQAPIRKNF